MARSGMTFKVDGAREIQRAFRTLPAKVAKKVARQAIRSGLKLVASAAKDNAPVETGFMKSKIKTRASAKRKRGLISLELRIGDKDFQGKAFYGAMREYGTKKMPGAHFMGARSQC